MKKGTIIGIVAVLAAIVLWGIGVNNKLVTEEENVSKAWSQVENAYKRRMDLIPQLVNTVQGAANYEKSVLTEVTNARAGVENTAVDPSTLSEYPELTATAGFRDLQTQLEGTENRIAVERGKFNEAVQKYNTKLRRFPTSLLAGILGFDKKGYFTAPAEAAEPVQVEFNF